MKDVLLAWLTIALLAWAVERLDRSLTRRGGPRDRPGWD